MSIPTTRNLGQSSAISMFGGISASIPNDGKVGLSARERIGKTTLPACWLG